MNELIDIEFYSHIKEIFAMVKAYWEIGKSIVEKQGGEQRAEYGTQLIKALSKQMLLILEKDLQFQILAI